MNVILIPLLKVLHAALNIYYWVVIIAVILNLLVSFNVINPHNPFIRSIGRALHQMTEPALSRIRRVVPSFGNIDVSPVILILGIYFVQWVIVELIVRLQT
jgi:YggT family protein